MLGYVDPANVSRVQRALDVLRQWQDASCLPLCTKFRSEHPWEQGCLEALLENSQVARAEIHIASGHMNLWNGPWGQFVRHVWGGPGKELRKWVFDDMIATLRLDVDTAAKRVAKDAVRKPVILQAECGS